jgi:ketosteroid isomerase-like protein
MSPPRPDETVRLLFEARIAADLRRMMALMTPDVVMVPATGAPVLVGAAAVGAYLARELGSRTRIEVEAHRICADGDRVHVYGRRRVICGGSLTDSPAAWTLTVRDGRVCGVEPLAAEAGLPQVA